MAPYEKQTWANGPGGGTPITAERLNHMEDGIEDAAEAGAEDLLLSDTRPTSPPVGLVRIGLPVSSDSTAPSVPEDFNASPGDGEVVLTWSASTDDVGVTSYKVRRDGVVIASPTGTTYTDTTVTNDVEYDYTVAAVDAAANQSAQSATETVTPTGEVEVVTLAEDDFNRADSISTLGTSSGGQTWIELGTSAMGIFSNEVKITTSYGGPTEGGAAVIECSEADVTVSCKLSAVTSEPGLIVRYIDDNNFIKVGKAATYQIVAGTLTLIGTTYAVPFASGETMSVVLNGTSITVKKDGATILSGTCTNTTGTKHGVAELAAGGSGTSDRWDDFLVTTP